ncbi:MAG: hypothetical protein FWD76_04625, partial [Firmicutes bacterium]|nr:hypothetical protein [Bacillota bacterium]
PTGNLDGDTSEVIFGILKELSQSTLVVVVSHDAESAVKYGDRIIKIENGKIVDDQVNLCQQTTQKMSEFPNGHPDNAGADNRDELSLSNAGETKDTKTPKSSNKQKGLSLSFAMRLGLGIIKKHLLRFVAVAILPVLFVGFVGVMVTMFTFDVNRRQLQLLYKYDSISNTMAVKAEWPRRDDNDFHWWQDNMPDALFGSEDGFFAQEQINDYASYGKVVLSVNDFDTSMYFAPQNGGGWSSTFESLYKMSSQSQWYSSEGKMVLWDDANGVGDVSNFEQIDAKGLVCGKMPNDQGGVLISDFVFNAYQKFGYKFADGPRVEVNSMQEFLDNKPLIDVRLKNNLEAVEQDAISTPIVGIYATKMNLDDAKEMYQKNFGVGYNPYRVYAPVSANMMVMGKQFFETNLAKNIKPRYKYAIVPKSGKKSKDIRYTKKSYQMREDGYMAYANAGSNNSDSKYLHNPWSAEIGGQFVGFGDFEMQSMRSSVRSYRDFFWVIAPAFVVVTVALSAYFAASTMASSRKQIGILRGLGASGKDIFAIYASESLIGTLITFGFGVVLVHTLLATTFNESQWFLGGFIPGIAQYGILLGGLLASTVLGVLGPMLKVCRRKPVEAIRAGAN